MCGCGSAAATHAPPSRVPGPPGGRRGGGAGPAKLPARQHRHQGGGGRDSLPPVQNQGGNVTGVVRQAPTQVSETESRPPT